MGEPTEKRSRIMIVDDDPLIQRSLQKILSKYSEVFVVSKAEDAILDLKDQASDLVIMDINLKGEMDGIEALKIIKRNWPDLQVIMVTGESKTTRVVEAIRLGAFNYLTKPMDVDELLNNVDQALKISTMGRRLNQLRSLVAFGEKEYRFIGSPVFLENMKKMIAPTASGDTTVLIEGETGTGKELVAREIHRLSARSSGPFVAVNCGAIPKDLVESEFFGHRRGAFTGAMTDGMGKLQLADGGTLLLDEIGELPLEAQAKLLRALETKEFYPVGGTRLVRVDLQILASTNRNLSEMVEEKTFREDLYYRLNVLVVTVSPLRERREDIGILAEHFRDMYNTQFGKKFTCITLEAMKILQFYHWKGNVRELRNAIERAVLCSDGDCLTESAFEYLNTAGKQSSKSLSLGPQGLDLDQEISKVEKQLLIEALEYCHGDKNKAAKLLNLSLPSLYYRLDKHSLTS